MKIQIAQIPDEIIAEYNLQNKVHSDGAVFIEIQKGMYGNPSISHWLSTTLESDTKTMSMPYIYYRHYASTMKPSLSIGQAHYIAA